MGASTSKASRAAGSAARQYPSRAATRSTPSSNPTAKTIPSSTGAAAPGPTVKPTPQAYGTRNEAIDLDARDPQFASRLSELGPVTPFPTYSPSSTVAATLRASSPTNTTKNIGSTGSPSIKTGSRFPSPSANPAVAILTARQRIQDQAEDERIAAGRPGFEGRQLLDIATVRKILALRDEQGMKAEDIEHALRLKKGLVQGLGRTGVVEAA